ncbi:MAG: hypothetical protein PHN64_02805 [Desulfovibrionaceae bacterium]|nr:hypothetical protein [Desulfovibrionaceae bacterium]
MCNKFQRVMALLVLVLGLSLPAFAAEKPVDGELTGKAWLASPIASKEAFLYGVASTVAIEQAIADKGGKPASVFVQQWMAAFTESTPADIGKQVDAWYTAHPDQQGRHVFDVLWYEFMQQKKPS